MTTGPEDIYAGLTQGGSLRLPKKGADVRRQARDATKKAQADDRVRHRLLPHQRPPGSAWYGWLLLAGRGAGKTEAAAAYITEHVHGPPCMPGPSPHWIGIIAPTLGDAVTSCFSGPSGIRAHDPSARLVNAAGGAVIRWANGSEAKLFGAREPEDVERLRAGGNRCVTWCEELAAWRYLDACWDQMRFGLRLGERPRFIASTTPKPRSLIKRLNAGEIPDIEVTRATTYDNPHLPQHIRDALEDTYGGTALGAQELQGLLIEQDENALWRRSWLDRDRVAEAPPDLIRVTVGVDPSGGAGEQGIVIVGKQKTIEVADGRQHVRLDGYVLDDRTCHLSPDGWGRRAVQAAIDHMADDIVVETNFGGDMAVAVIRGAATALDLTIPIRTVRASRGKRPRAEPVAALAERGQWHIVGRYDDLESQLCTWTPEADNSPDRLDAMVWAAWHLRLVSTHAIGTAGSFPANAMTQPLFTIGRNT